MKVRSPTIAILAALGLALALVGAQGLDGVEGPPAVAPTEAAEQPTLEPAPVCPLEDEVVLEEGAEARPRPCRDRDCPRALGDNCERVSCNPCCYSCPGLPYWVCTS